MTLLNDTLHKSIEDKFNLFLHLVDYEAHYIVTPKGETTKALHFMINYTNMVTFLSELCNIETELVTHGGRIYTVFRNKN